MIYPLLFGLTYCLLLAYFLKKLNKLNVPFSYLCLLPIIAGIADYLENFGIIAMLKSYPELREIAVKTTSSFSFIKSISTSVFFIVLFIVIIILGFKAINRKKQVRTKAKLSWVLINSDSYRDSNKIDEAVKIKRENLQLEIEIK